ncbi:MAG TPA: RluA family pseudouridine synthase [Cytophagaceae bacterium]|nr:RluA family pseudouridine synthase [Cytophagaceae bacterium]
MQPAEFVNPYQQYFDVVYEDNHLIAVNKRSGVLVQGDTTGDTPLSEYVKLYLKEKYEKPGNVFAGVIHRLDRPVSGITLLAKTSKALERMNEQFREKQTQKIYHALVKNEPQHPEGTLIHWLTKDTKKNVSRAHSKEIPDSKKCELHYKILKKTDRYFLLEVQPVSGRSHQIRCQLAAMGCPIKGDLKYGFARSNQDGGISLHAYELHFNHPISKEAVSIHAPYPTNSSWDMLKS